MKRRVFYFLLVVCFVFIFQPGTVSAAGEQIRVKGVDILKDPDRTVECGGGTASYNPDTKTLTLNNAVIDEDSKGAPLTYGIEIQGEGITVELVGSSTISAHIGIDSGSPLSIKGTSGGSLTIRADQAYSSLSCRGISIAGGGLTVQNANLEIILGKIGDASGYALYITGGDNLISNSHIKITAESGSSTAADAEAQGINATGANSVKISDNSSIVMENLDDGIGAYGANVVVSGSSLSIPDAVNYAVSCKNLEIINGAKVNAAVKTGVAVGANNIAVSGSTVHVESEQSNALACGNLEIKDSSNITAKGYWPAFYVENNTDIKNSSIETETTNDVGIFCKGPVEIEESKVKAIGGTGKGSILARGNISITGGSTEIGEGSISSNGDIHIGGIITSNGKPSYDNIKGGNGGKVEFQAADYSEVDEAIAEAEKLNKDDYENFEEVEKAVQAVVRGKNFTEQDVVDGYAAAIKAAIAALKPVSSDQNVYKIVEGADQTIVIGDKKDITIKADGDFDKFTGLSIDGKEVAKENYTVASGSTVITLKAEYVKTLSVGAHTVTINYTDGKAETKLTLKEDKTEGSTQDPSKDESKDESKNPSQNQTNKDGTSPRTGDHLPIGWIIALIGSAAIGLAAVRYRIKLQNMR